VRITHSIGPGHVDAWRRSQFLVEAVFVVLIELPEYVGIAIYQKVSLTVFQIYGAQRVLA
jgi:hypothetical protein